MAKGAYIGVNGVVRKIKKGYIGVDGKARKIKKAYIGVGGVARPCWSGGELVYYGLVSNSKFAVNGSGNNSATLNGLGVYTPEYTNNVYAINNNLTVSAAAQDRGHTYKAYPGCAENGKYVLFAGGANSQVGAEDWDIFCTNVTAYNSALTRTSATAVSAYRQVGGRAGNSAVFVSDYYGRNVYAYNQSLTQSSKTYTSVTAITNVYQSAVASNGTRLIALLYNYADSKTYGYAFNSSLTATKVTVPSLSMNNHYDKGNGGRVGDYAVFSGCYVSEDCFAYNQSLTMTTLTPLSKYNTGGVSVNAGENYDYLIFAGDVNGSNQGTTHVYDASLTISAIPRALSKLREGVLGVNAGKYALFLGGYDRTDSFDEHASADVYMFD